jgi:hypothetical protein
MPFSQEFDDVYTFGIRGAAEDAGAYAERVDEQIFTDGILDRIFNQINKADVIVADMTGRNANVFYEVGYAHALGKLVLLLTQNSDDIPFDLKHRPHIVYGGKIAKLRLDLAKRIEWAIGESKKQNLRITADLLLVSIKGQILPEAYVGQKPPIILEKPKLSFNLWVEIRNDASQPFVGATHIYLMTEESSAFIPCRIVGKKVKRPLYKSSGDSIFFNRESQVIGEEEVEELEYSPLWPLSLIEDGLGKELPRQYRLPSTLGVLPSGAIEQLMIPFRVKELVAAATARFRLRIHTADAVHDYDFCLTFAQTQEDTHVAQVSRQITQRSAGRKPRKRSSAG